MRLEEEVVQFVDGPIPGIYKIHKRGMEFNVLYDLVTNEYNPELNIWHGRREDIPGRYGLIQYRYDHYDQVQGKQRQIWIYSGEYHAKIINCRMHYMHIVPGEPFDFEIKPMVCSLDAAH